MTLIIQNVKNQNKITSVKIIINSIENPLTLFLLELTEVEFQKISEEQKLLINFENFSNYIINLLELCKKNINYTAHIFVNESPEILFLIEEKIKQKINENIKIKLRKANDEEIKNYMNKIYLELRANFSEIYNLLNDQNIKLDNLNKENALLNENIKKMENENNQNLDQLQVDKEKELNELKSLYIKEHKENSENDEIEKKNMINKYENKIAELENKIQILIQNTKILEENNNKNGIIKNDLENKYKTLLSELDLVKNENNKIKSEKDIINKQNIEMTKDNSELKSQNGILKQEIEQSQKNNFDLNIVIDNLKRQNNSNEMNIKYLNNQNLNLSEKIETFKNEINKGNSIIEKLELDLKNKKSKLKAIKQTVETQEQLIKQKENIINIQNKTIDELKSEKELKDNQIKELTNKVNDYVDKLKENEKLLEENKKMILYLNKNITEITSAPFNSRTQKQQEFIEKYNNMSGTLFQDHNTLEEIKYKSFNDRLYDKNINNNLEDDLIALPETNFCNYKLSGQLGGTMDKYINKKNFGNLDDLNNLYGNYDNYYENNSLLRHKYGNNNFNDINDNLEKNYFSEIKYDIIEQKPKEINVNEIKESENNII